MHRCSSLFMSASDRKAPVTQSLRNTFGWTLAWPGQLIAGSVIDVRAKFMELKVKFERLSVSGNSSVLTISRCCLYIYLLSVFDAFSQAPSIQTLNLYYHIQVFSYLLAR